MKLFTKLALVSAVAISSNAMAMQAMDDAALSSTTGQDGISIGIGIAKVEIAKLHVFDGDGLDSTLNGADGVSLGGTGDKGATPGKGAGAITINKVVVSAPMLADGSGPDTTRMLDSHNLADLTIDTDGGAGKPFLNVAAAVSGLDIYIGEIGVSASNALPAAGATTIRRGATDTAYSASNTTGNYNKILSGLTIKTGKMDANIQLGAAPQGAMIVLNTTMQGGLEIKNLGIVDSSTKTGTADGTTGNRAAGQIFLESIKVSDANAANLTVKAAVSVVGKEDTNNGYLRIITGSGATTPKTDMYIKGVHLGSQAAASIGDVEVQGLQTYYFNGTANVQGSVITISGH